MAYDGTDFEGWQSQRSGNTVQDHIERRLAQIFQEPIRIHGSGRTDAGVHAKAQVFHFDGAWHHPEEHLLRALRSGFPDAIQVTRVKQVSDSFHARYSATGKRYRYRLYEGFALPAENRYCWSLGNRKTDIAPMRAGAARLLGEHDFTAFAANRRDESKENPVKELRKLDITRQGPRITITTEASGYLYKMVRSLVGALVDVGVGKLTPDDLEAILESGRRTARVATAPPQGLSLERVFYRQ